MNKLESPSPKDALCQVWLKLACSAGEEDENVKSLRQWRTTDKAHLRFWLRWAKNVTLTEFYIFVLSAADPLIN